MAFKRMRLEKTGASACLGADDLGSGRSEAMRRALMEDGLSQLLGTIEALRALEERLQLVEDEITAGEALTLPALPRAQDVGICDLEPRLMETALLIGATIRRMNLRLGGVERALDGREPFGEDDTIVVRSPAYVRALNYAAEHASVA